MSDVLSQAEVENLLNAIDGGERPVGGPTLAEGIAVRDIGALPLAIARAARPLALEAAVAAMAPATIEELWPVTKSSVTPSGSR